MTDRISIWFAWSLVSGAVFVIAEMVKAVIA
jgi:hypothetical protein